MNSIVIFFGTFLLRGVHVKSFWSALGVSVLLGLINVTIKPLLVLLTLPITILTLGLFILVINAWMLMLIDKLLDGFTIYGFGWALLFGIYISIANTIMAVLLG